MERKFIILLFILLILKIVVDSKAIFNNINFKTVYLNSTKINSFLVHMYFVLFQTIIMSAELPRSDDSPKFVYYGEKITLENFVEKYRYNLPQVVKVQSGFETGKVRCNDHEFKYIIGIHFHPQWNPRGIYI